MRTKGRTARLAIRMAVTAAAAAVLPGIVAACGARDGLYDSAAPPADQPDAAPDVVVLDAPPDVVVLDAPPDVVEIDAPPDVGPDVMPVELHGCADGTREAFFDPGQHPDIAGCAGAFTLPGIFPDALPSCGRKAGNDGIKPFGQGCGAADLCAAGWHVCRSAAEVAKRSPDGCQGAADAAPGSFFATGQSGPGCGLCATGTSPTCGGATCENDCVQTSQTTNDLFGCGTAGDTPDQATCGVLDRFGNNLSADLPGTWVCPADPSGDVRELVLVTKTGPDGGGVLCCRD